MASGTFDVKLAPQPDENADPTLGRMSIDKQFHGDLEAGSKGQMLAGKMTIRIENGKHFYELQYTIAETP